jgi:hypothetical protein
MSVLDFTIRRMSANVDSTLTDLPGYVYDLYETKADFVHRLTHSATKDATEADMELIHGLVHEYM